MISKKGNGCNRRIRKEFTLENHVTHLVKHFFLMKMLRYTLISLDVIDSRGFEQFQPFAWPLRNSFVSSYFVLITVGIILKQKRFIYIT